MCLKCKGGQRKRNEVKRKSMREVTVRGGGKKGGGGERE